MTEAQRRSAAHNAVGCAVRDGFKERPGVHECESGCGRNAHLWHHWSYDEPHWLDTIPMCRSCHARVHRGKLPEPRTGRVYDWAQTDAAMKRLQSNERALWRVRRARHTGKPVSFVRREQRDAAAVALDAFPRMDGVDFSAIQRARLAFMARLLEWAA